MNARANIRQSKLPLKSPAPHAIRSIIKTCGSRVAIAEILADLKESDALHRNDGQVKASHAGYGVPVVERLLSHATIAIEKIVGFPLFPTYSYARIYDHGATLERHTDRPSCELTLTVTLSAQGPLWPLYLAKKNGAVEEVLLSVGDGLLIFGQDLPHWRGLYEGCEQSQALLHYVRQDGPLSHSSLIDENLCGHMLG